MRRTDLNIGFRLNPTQPLENLKEWGVEILEHSIDSVNYTIRDPHSFPILTFKYRIPVKGLKLEFCIGPHLDRRRQGGKYMFARVVKNESDDYYQGEQTITQINAFAFQGFVIPEELNAENILAGQKLFHKFNIEFNSKGIEIVDFCEKGNNYSIALDIISTYKLELIKVEKETAYFKYSQPSVHKAACERILVFTLPRSVNNVEIEESVYQV